MKTKNNETTKESGAGKRILLYFVLLGIALIVFELLWIQADTKLEYQAEMTVLFCEMHNTEIDLLEQTLPAHIENQCEDLRIILEDKEKADAMCRQLRNLELPDKSDCEDYIL